MAQITKLTKLNGKKVDLSMFAGLHVADADHAKLDIIRYLRRYNGKDTVELVMEKKEMEPGGGWEYQDQVENY